MDKKLQLQQEETRACMIWCVEFHHGIFYFSSIQVAHQQAEMRMVRWMCNVKVKDRVPSKELREKLGMDDKYWYYSKTGCEGIWACAAKRRHWLVKEMYGIWVEGSRPRGRPNRTWREVVQKDCQARNLNREDAMDHSRWKKLIKLG